uniref:RING-type E3 ubiquitin transferase n=1 Tax=Ananas comosus var. bracteatus TaxID=296719 RepID=A0A6V7NFD9_ANACO|nr:unnamed protein product [Ananas comosus var. bracteatus]
MGSGYSSAAAAASRCGQCERRHPHTGRTHCKEMQFEVVAGLIPGFLCLPEGDWGVRHNLSFHVVTYFTHFIHSGSVYSSLELIFLLIASAESVELLNKERRKMSSRNTHWCYVCMQAVRPHGQNMTCPNCSEGFVQELHEIGSGIMNSLNLFRLESDEDFDQDPRLRIMELISALVRRGSAGTGRDIRTRTDTNPDLAMGRDTGLC